MPAVLLVTPYLPPHIGGVERYVESIARELVTLNWRVVIATPVPHGVEKRRGRGVGQLPGSPIQIRPLNAFGRISNTPVGFHWKTDLRRIIEEDEIDIVNAHTPAPGLADAAQCAAGDVPFVLTYHAGPMRKNRAVVDLGLRAYERCVVAHTVRRSSYLICNSVYVRTFLEGFSHSTPVEVIAPSVNLSQYSFAPYEGRQRLLFVASLERATRYKGLDTLVEAIALMHTQGDRVHLDVIGDGNARSEYEAQCAILGVSHAVTFHGAVDPAKLSLFYQRASALVLPARFDSFPTVVLEAMACGTPTIASTVGGIPSMIQDEQSGLLIEPDRPDQIVSAVRRLTANRRFAASLGAAARKTVEASWSTEVQGRRTSEAFERVLCMKPTRRRPLRKEGNWAERSGGQTTDVPPESESGRHDETTRQMERSRTRPLLVHVAGYYPPHLGGMEQVVRAAAEGLAARGNNVLVLTSDGGGSSSGTSQTPYLTVKRLRSRDIAHTPIAPSLISELFRLPKPAIVHLHLGLAFYPELVWLVCRVRRIPYVLHFHGDLGPSGPLGALFVLYKATILRGVLRGADRIVVFSDEQRRFIYEQYRVALNRIVIIPNGVSPEFFLPVREQRLPHHLLYVGRLSVQKRVDRLLAAIGLMTHQVQLTIVGGGEDEAALRQQVTDLKLANITFAGVLTGPALLERYASADIFVLASDREGMPLVLLEAMAAGLPIVGTNVDGIQELVKGVGVLVDDPVPQRLAAALDELLDHPESLAKLARQSIAKAQEFSWPKSLGQFEHLYDELTE